MRRLFINPSCTGDARSHHGIAVVEQFVAPVGRIIARELREQAAPIEPCGTRLDVVRIAGFDMAGDLLQRRCPIPASCNQNRRLVENLATNHFLPEPLLERILRVGLQARDYALPVMAVEWKDESRRRVACVGEHDGDAGVHACRHQCAGQGSLRGIDNDPGEVFDRDADFAVILLDAALAVGKLEPRGLGQVHAFPRHVRNSR